MATALQNSPTPLALHREEWLTDLQQRRDNPGRLWGLSTGFKRVDRTTGGLKPGELVLVAARPGMGKTALLLSIARAAHRQCADDELVVFFSLEMSTRELLTRLIAAESGVPQARIRRGTIDEVDDELIQQAADGLCDDRFIIDDTTSLTVEQISQRLSQIAASGKRIKLVIVDYLGLISPETDRTNIAYQIGEQTRRLKCLARDYETPLLLACQLNREVEKDADRKPKLHHLRDSGALEQDADVVWFIHRKGYYVKPGEAGYEPHMEHHAGLICSKARNGALWTTAVRFDGPTASFDDYDDADYAELKALGLAGTGVE